ncbi:MAG: helix-hairpin-helix domain-containing protein [Planctomycetota bacterium]|nr:helix-hairpin-helix domain-containing protein [Planctomycetota bacterium]
MTLGVILLAAMIFLGIRSWVQDSFNSGRPVSGFDQGQRRHYLWVVDLNKADWAEVALLPGIGKELALRIIAFREGIRGFEVASQLLEIKGIGPKKLKAIQPLISLESLPKAPETKERV